MRLRLPRVRVGHHPVSRTLPMGLRSLIELPLLPQAACEGCDLSFGPIPITVEVDVPDHREVTVTLCAEDPTCQQLGRSSGITADGYPVPWTATGDTGAIPSGSGSFVGLVGGRGHLTCKVPALEITVEADGCEPEVVLTERSRDDRAQPPLTTHPSCPSP